MQLLLLSKHSTHKNIHQYLAASGIQAQPSNSELKLPASAYSSSPTNACPQLENFDITDFTTMFPSNTPHVSSDTEGPEKSPSQSQMQIEENTITATVKTDILHNSIAQ